MDPFEVDRRWHSPGLAWLRACGVAVGPAGGAVAAPPAGPPHSPVLVVLGRVLAVQCGCSAVHPVGWRHTSAPLLCQVAVWKVQLRPLLIRREVGGHSSWGA